MNPLTRFVATALFVVLVALVAMLAVPVWREARSEAAGTRSPAGQVLPAGTTAPNRSIGALALSQRLALGLAIVGLALALPLMLSLGVRPSRPSDTPTPFRGPGAELSTLVRLAESTVAQGAELTRERDVRRLAEEDARLKQQLLTQSLDEKIRLGRDLHDGIIQSLYAAGLTLESVRALIQSNPAEAEQRLEQTRTSLNNAIRDVRAYIVGLTPETLRHAGFARALSGLLGELRAGREAQFDLQIDDEAAVQLTPGQSVEALQIAREAVSNALRHGGASMITVRMHQGDHEICLLIQDNGRGFDAARSRDGGHGMANMKARTERIGATLRVTSDAATGTRVLATLPILHPTAT